ncbi:MAG: hypothetical protein B6244_08075 [Candidatus Cloacimonetes bacterium 4572_55]|nr:MAG: hypothetical protein B6244_08075 [Candidatus Cloacimonetes bacterium 4572_55]
MRKSRWILLLLIAVVLVMGCDDDCWDDDCDDEYYDRYPPDMPTGFYSVTGDQEVRLYWDHNHESDLDGYKLYWNDEPYGNFELVTFTNNDYYLDRSVENGRTYYYALAAIDYNGNESELTYEDIFDTPRPEGYNVRLFPLNGNEYDQDRAGWDFDFYQTRYWEDPRSDMTYEYYWDEDHGRDFHYLNFPSGVKIQYWGMIDHLDEINYAPNYNWENPEWVELEEGEAYVLKIYRPTREVHYAKIHITHLDAGMMTFDWAYQIDPDNRELRLKPVPDKQDNATK